ncbi:SPOR domain-containing protein [Falsiroseomonas oryziterrae]|uniref:SPOR domain-containing protein n=1 Tax=Falsiroseomonas oryziterrae TaxID=2911368 RepID=UPI001F011720|nr:SPOR domain-containing protein [Roseomonas sp. NPKOSM-4]
MSRDVQSAHRQAQRTTGARRDHRRFAKAAAAATPLAFLVACADGARGTAETATATPAQLRVIAASAAVPQGDPALSALRRAAVAEPSNPATQARFGAALARAGELAAAEDVILGALATHPDHPALLNQLGRLRLRAGAPEVALALFDRAAPLDRSHESLEGRGIALDLLGRHEEAQDAYRAALVVAPRQASVQNNLAMSLLLTGRATEALALLEPLAARRDVPARVTNNLAVARSMAGDAPGGSARDPAQLAEATVSLRTMVGAAPARPPAGDTLLAAPRLPAETFAASIEPAQSTGTMQAAAVAAPSVPPPTTTTSTAPASEAEPPRPVTLAALPVVPPPAPVEIAPLPSPVAAPRAAGAELPPRRPVAAAPVRPSAEFRTARFTVQVAALGSEAAARSYWASLQERRPDRFGDREADIFRAEVNQAVFWRVRASGFATLAEARAFCEALRADGRACWVPSAPEPRDATTAAAAAVQSASDRQDDGDRSLL